MVSVAIFIRLEAKPGKEDQVAELLREALPLVNDEPGTVAWFAVKFSPSTYGIFDAFPNEDARQDHLAGKLATELTTKGAELFSVAPVIEMADVIVSKLP